MTSRPSGPYKPAVLLGDGVCDDDGDAVADGVALLVFDSDTDDVNDTVGVTDGELEGGGVLDGVWLGDGVGDDDADGDGV